MVQKFSKNGQKLVLFSICIISIGSKISDKIFLPAYTYLKTNLLILGLSAYFFLK